VAPPTRAWTVAVHQIYANLLETGGATRATLRGRLEFVPSFAGILPEEWTRLFDWMVAEGWLDESDGSLLLGTRAEKVFGARNFFRLYAVFESPNLLTVRHGNQEIGTIQAWFAGQLTGSQKAFRLAGRGWVAEEIDLNRGQVRARPAPAGVVPTWSGRPTGFSRPVCERIRDLLSSQAEPEGLSEAARGWLAHARQQLAHVPHRGRLRPVLIEDEHLVWYTFAGSQINAVLARLLQHAGSPPSISNLRVKIRGTRSELVERMLRAHEALADDALPPLDEWATFDPTARSATLSSFQACLPEELEQEYLRGALLDIDGARRWAREVDVALVGREG
jgi:ATP-dependent Lhr-like helicase